MTAPLVPSEVDLQAFAYMPMDVRRLRDSDMASLESPEACWAAVLLWAASWHQVPAASLPDDDRVLSNLAGYGRVVKEWLRVRDGALRGWVKCDDGRLYHPVVAEKALEAWNSKQAHSYGKFKERMRKANRGDIDVPSLDEWIGAGSPSTWPPPSAGIPGLSAGIPPEKEPPSAGIPPETTIPPPEIPKVSAGKHKSSAGIPPENALKGEGEGKGKGKGEVNTHGVPALAEGTPSGRICARLRRDTRMADANPQHPRLLALLDAGLSEDEIIAAGEDAMAKGKGFAYALATAEGRRREAANVKPLPALAAAGRLTQAGQRTAAAAVRWLESEGVTP